MPYKSGSTFVGSEPRNWDAPPFTVVVPEVCKRCNTGWMSDLEGDAAPIITPMLAGQKVLLGDREQTILARWLVKTAMVYQATTEHQAIKPHQYRYLKMHFRPPPATQFWLATRTPKNDRQPALLTIRTSELRPGAEVGVTGGRRHDAYLTTLAIFQFLGQVFGHDLPFDSPWTRGRAFGHNLQAIWPVTGIVTWPPPHLDPSGLNSLAGPRVRG